MIKELFLATIISTSVSVRTPNDEDKPLDYEFSVKAEKNEGKFTFYDRVMKDSKLGVYDKITIKKAFIKSSNVGISRIISDNYKSNPTAFTDRIYKMGLSTPLKLELPFPDNLKSPNPNKKPWSGTSLPWMSIGYEMQLTPIHMLTFYNAIANQGKMIKPIFTSAISRDGKIIEKRTTEVINPAICSKATVDAVIPLLIGVVEEGTAKNIKTSNYLIAGKTGTTNSKADAWFVGFTPQLSIGIWIGMDDPAVSLGKDQFGSAAALPIFANTISKIYKTGEYQYMDKTILLNKHLDWPMSQGVVEVAICKETYEKATRFCSATKEIYLKANRPRQMCQKHSSPFSRFKDK